MKQVVFLYNPRSGKGHAEVMAEGVCRVFREHGFEARSQCIDFTQNPFDGNEDIDIMIAAGGDGTINYVVNGMKSKGLDIELGVIPVGTANDFAGALGMSNNPLKAARQIAEGAVRRIDCGRVNGLYFVNVLSFGLFTTTSQRTPDKYKHRVGKLAYLVEGAKELVSIHAVPLHIWADGEVFNCNAQMALIFNGETAGGFRLARGSNVSDGLLDCILLEKKQFFRSFYAMTCYLCGADPKSVRHVKARRIEITSSLDEPTDIDGQPGARFPLHIECLAGALRVICPRER